VNNGRNKDIKQRAIIVHDKCNVEARIHRESEYVGLVEDGRN
jgi:hypothetical protein